MRKFIAALVVIAVIGAIVVGVKGSDIIGFFYDFFKNASVWCYHIMIKIADAFHEFMQTRFGAGNIMINDLLNMHF